ncbi:MAG: hypothetical protein GY854_05535 [Deltaproteobacteria bacterium]|nr:hypothetical protein [Deltaproteobacteria bacterium]
MNDVSCSAPGKLFLGGEYAVLQGAEAVVTAVDRRIIAMTCREVSYTSPIVVAVRQQMAHLLESEPETARDIPLVEVISTGFRIRREKIGLGSSAAVAAAVSGALFEWSGKKISEHRSQILDLAIQAHRDVQGGRGSGADVAAAVHGGTLIFTMDGVPEAIDISGVEIVAVWSGRAASTTQLIGKINDFAERDARTHRACFDELEAGAARLAEAYRSARPKSIIAETGNYRESMNRLGQASGAPIVASEHDLVTTLARDLGGAAKPSGAGGGDVAIAVFEDPEAARRLRSRCRSHGLIPLDTNLSAPGLYRESQRE